MADIRNEVPPHLTGFLHRRSILEDDQKAGIRQDRRNRCKPCHVPARLGRQIPRGRLFTCAERRFDCIEKRRLPQRSYMMTSCYRTAKEVPRTAVGNNDPLIPTDQQGGNGDSVQYRVIQSQNPFAAPCPSSRGV